jgi:hypothetical protein
MKVEILHHPGDGNYSWKLWTGPDGIDFYDGICSSIGEVFEEIIKHEIWNGMDYCGEKLKIT